MRTNAMRDACTARSVTIMNDGDKVSSVQAHARGNDHGTAASAGVHACVHAA
jgi:hypothetical protein